VISTCSPESRRSQRHWRSKHPCLQLAWRGTAGCQTSCHFFSCGSYSAQPCHVRTALCHSPQVEGGRPGCDSGRWHLLPVTRDSDQPWACSAAVAAASCRDRWGVGSGSVSPLPRSAPLHGRRSHPAAPLVAPISLHHAS
jgi:hypothetical protein